jgi:hypothetical protein
VASRLTKWLFPNRYVIDYSGYPKVVTGRLAVETLNLSGFDPYRADDSALKKIVFFVITLAALSVAVLAMDQVTAIGNKIGCWTIPLVLFFLFAIFHQVRMRFGKRSDEELLQKAIPIYRQSHSDQCPACDGAIGTPLSDGLRICDECKGEWQDVEESTLNSDESATPS